MTPTIDANTLQRLLDESAIRAVVDGIDNAVDDKAWDECRRYFSDDIYVDFTSLAGGEPGQMPADNLIDGWRTNLYADKLSHHMAANHRITIDGDNAEVFSKGYAFNLLPRAQGDALWEVWGNYVHTLSRTGESEGGGWQCTGISFFATHARGNETVRTFVPDN